MRIIHKRNRELKMARVMKGFKPLATGTVVSLSTVRFGRIDGFRLYVSDHRKWMDKRQLRRWNRERKAAEQ